MGFKSIPLKISLPWNNTLPLRLIVLLGLLVSAGCSDLFKQASNSVKSISDSTNTDQVTLELTLTTEDNGTVTLSNGASFQLYKADKLLQDVLLKNNAVSFAPVKEEPPYRYVLSSSKIDKIEPERLGSIPIDTQGGLLPTNLLTILASPTPIQRINAKIKAEGTLTDDLRKAQKIALKIDLKAVNFVP